MPAPYGLWVGDVPHVATWQGFVRVAVVIGAVARRIVGWRVGAPCMPGSCWSIPVQAGGNATSLRREVTSQPDEASIRAAENEGMPVRT